MIKGCFLSSSWCIAQSRAPYGRPEGRRPFVAALIGGGFLCCLNSLAQLQPIQQSLNFIKGDSDLSLGFASMTLQLNCASACKKILKCGLRRRLIWQRESSTKQLMECLKNPGTETWVQRYCYGKHTLLAKHI